VFGWVARLGWMVGGRLSFPRTKQTLSNLVIVPTPLRNAKIVGRTHVRDRHQCQFGTRRVRPTKDPHTRDVLLLASDRDHASASRCLGQFLRLSERMRGGLSDDGLMRSTRTMMTSIIPFIPFLPNSPRGARAHTHALAYACARVCVYRCIKREIYY
jgi:hypothetical protein